MKGQVSIELIIIVAIILALVLIVASKLQETAKKTTEQIGQTESEVFKVINETTQIGSKDTGESCTAGAECKSGVCENGICK
jgi:Sec-independent protein translocase protein TatA